MAYEKVIEALEAKADFTHDDIVISRKACGREMAKMIEAFDSDPEAKLALDSNLAHLIQRLENLYQAEVKYRHRMESIKTVKWAAKEVED